MTADFTPIGDCEDARSWWGIECPCSDATDHSDLDNLIEIRCGCGLSGQLVCPPVAEVIEFIAETATCDDRLARFIESEVAVLTEMRLVVDELATIMAPLPTMAMADPLAYAAAEGIPFLGSMDDPEIGSSLRDFTARHGDGTQRRPGFWPSEKGRQRGI